MKYLPLLLFLFVPFDAAGAWKTSDIVLERFSAARFQDMITLQWSTIGERGDLGFEIERRSQHDADWQTVAYVRGQGDAAVRSYSFLDRVRANTLLFYRLKRIDMSGKTLVTPAVTVTPEHFDASIRLRTATPLPAIEYNQISLALPREGDVRVRLFDVLGREMKEFGTVRTYPAGYHVIPFRSADLPAGVYSVRLETEEGTLVDILLRTS